MIKSLFKAVGTAIGGVMTLEVINAAERATRSDKKTSGPALTNG